MKARAKMIRSQPGWWFNLAPLKKGFDIVELFKKYKFDLHVLTKAPHSVDEAWTEKVKWCRVHLPNTDITISQEKGLVYGKVLLDDWPPYVSSWLEHRPRGLVIMVEQRWNKDFEHPQVIKYNGTNLAEIENTLVKFIEKHERGLAGIQQ
jgi:5'-nucleotidase